MRERELHRGHGEGWGVDLAPAGCEACDRRYLLPAGGASSQRCPHCFQAPLRPLADAEGHLPYTRPPELVLPFTVSEQQIAERIAQFARGIPFAPEDLAPATLQRRLCRVYVPTWLVDAGVEARFQAEVGFDYEVVSHQDRFSNGEWKSHEVRETRVRWEPRVGRLQRHYDNVAAPALEEEATVQQQVGAYSQEKAEAYRPGHLAQTVVRLPDRSPDDAWPDAVPRIRATATAETRRAAKADHIREFRWAARYPARQWTQLLRPLYATYYLDDEQRPRPVFLHGQTAQIHGQRRASMQRARRAALIIGAVAGLIFFLGLVLVLVGLAAVPELTAIGVMGVALAFLVGMGSLVPPLIVWQFNRRQQRADNTP